MKEFLEHRQISIYFVAVILAVLIALVVPSATVLEVGINPALALMLFVTFLQVPLAELGRIVKQIRFLAALLAANFVMVPLLVWGLALFLPLDPLMRLGVFLVLLTPCIDYVVTFTQFGRGDARLLLAATPMLLVVQIPLLSLYLRFFLGKEAAHLIQVGPFLHAFVWLIAAPLLLAALSQRWAAATRTGRRFVDRLSVFPVPAAALVLFIVVAAMVPELAGATEAVLAVVPLYVAFAILAPCVGALAGRLFRLDPPARRALAFSAATRNSLVVLPLALAVPGAVPLLPAVIITQTLIELASELVYVRYVAKWVKF